MRVGVRRVLKPFKKLNFVVAQQIRRDAEFMTQTTLAGAYGVSRTAISKILNNQSWSVSCPSES